MSRRGVNLRGFGIEAENPGGSSREIGEPPPGADVLEKRIARRKLPFRIAPTRSESKTNW